MTPELYARASELVGEMLALPTSDWVSALESAEANDPGIRAIAERLLEASEQTSGFLDDSIAALCFGALIDDPFGLVGRTLDKTYVIEELIGQGGIGVVYRARHTALPKKFAIKVIPQEVSAKVSIEGEAGCLIHHPAVVAVTDSKILPSGDLYLAMDFVEGESLRHSLQRRGVIGLDEAVHIAAQVGSALDAAHEAGFVHRDIKPENILLASTGNPATQVRVIDFGIAGHDPSRNPHSDPELTGIGIGTPAYMAPEQWDETLIRAGGIDARADVYSLAVVFFEMLTRQRPATGSHATLRHTVTGGRQRRLVELAPEVPARISEAVARALAVSPDDRPASAGEFIDSLRDGISHPVRPRRASVPMSSQLVPMGRLDVPTPRGPASIEFYVGDILAMPRDWNVDILVVSANRNDYAPTPGTLIESLLQHGVNVERLARHMEFDMRAYSSCWLSRDLGRAGATLPVRRILGFEPVGVHTPASKIDDVFLTLMPVLANSDDGATVAMSLVGTGGKMGLVATLVEPLVKSAMHWMQAGLNMDRLVVVEKNREKARQLESQIKSAKRFLG